MTSPLQKSLLALVASLAFTSCGDSPELVAKRDQQKAEITRLKGELALIDEKLKNLPPDVSSELAEAKALSAKQNAEVESLENEIASLQQKKATLEKDFEAYQVKYKAN